MTRAPLPRLASSWFAAVFFKPENYVPVAVAYGVSMCLFGAVLVLEPALEARPIYAAFGSAHVVWGAVTLVLGGLQLAMLLPGLRRWLFAASAVNTFVWLWIALAFLLSMGHLSTAQAMYVPASTASAWLAVRTAPLTR